VALALTGLALTAWLYVPSRQATAYYGANSARLMIYVLPFLLPMAAFAIARVLPSWRPPPAPGPASSRWGMAAAAAVAACLLVPFVVLDPYRRVPLHDHRDGPLVLQLCREGLRTARRIDDGREVTFDLESEAPLGRGESLPMSRIRWFLREGWSDDAPYSVGPVSTSAADASILLPCLRPRDLVVTLVAFTGESERPALLVNGKPLGRWQAGSPVKVPGEFLFRGDNVLTLRARPGGIRLRRLTYAADPQPSAP
jgi:hypothetical protein